MNAAVNKHLEKDDAEKKPVKTSADIEGSVPDQPGPIPLNYLHGWRLHISTIALFLALFLANFEVSVVSASLVGITNDLLGFNRSNWIVTAYLVAYTACFIIWAKLSDIFGRRNVLGLALLIFTIFSGACGASQDIVQIIVFRAFQGIGGSGTFSVSTVMGFELVPPPKTPKYLGILSIVFAVSYSVGPVVGGAISTESTWRWVFLLNVPGGAIAGGLLLLTVPPEFPYQGGHPGGNRRQESWRSKLHRLDYPGVFLLLAASVLIVVGFEEAGIEFPWSSALVITCITISGLLWISLFLWEWYATKRERAQEPIFPLRFLQNRAFVGMLLNTFFTGAPYTIAIVQIPQRFQAANGLSPLQAGLRLLPLVFSSPLGSFTASILAKTRAPSALTLLFASVLQIIGSTLLSTLPEDYHVRHAEYGFEVILGFGLGLSLTTLLLLVPLNTERRDQSIAMGALYQFRALGGAVGLAAVAGVTNAYIRSHLTKQVSEDTLNAILKNASSISTLPERLQNEVRSLFSVAYNTQMKIVIGFSAAQFLFTLLILKRKT